MYIFGSVGLPARKNGTTLQTYPIWDFDNSPIFPGWNSIDPNLMDFAGFRALGIWHPDGWSLLVGAALVLRVHSRDIRPKTQFLVWN